MLVQANADICMTTRKIRLVAISAINGRAIRQWFSVLFIGTFSDQFMAIWQVADFFEQTQRRFIKAIQPFTEIRINDNTEIRSITLFKPLLKCLAADDDYFSQCGGPG